MDISSQENQLLLNIQKSFFLLEPLDNFLVDLICLNRDFSQEKLLQYTIHHHIIKKYPNKRDYTIRFLKMVISLLEYNRIEAMETMYNEYVHLLSSKSGNKNYYYRHFIINQKISVIKNTYSMISRGTTGLCVWEGAMVLAEWCLQNKNLFEEKTVLELGCGVGLVGLTAIVNCKCKQYIFSDCNDEVLDLVRHNVLINTKDYSNLCLTLSEFHDIDDSQQNEVGDVLSDLISKVSGVNINDDSSVETLEEIDKDHSHQSEPNVSSNDIDIFNNTKISIKNLSFEEIALLKSNDILCDIVLASDIVYDTDLFPSLRDALVNVLNHNQTCKAIFACKIRNMDTFNSFVEILKETKILQVSEGKLDSQNLFFFSDQKMYSMVKILEIRSSKVLKKCCI